MKIYIKLYYIIAGRGLGSASIDNKNKKILAIGDNLNTDIKGANLLNYDSLLISNGIHRNEIKNKGIQDVSKEYEAIVNFIQSDLKW